VLFKFIRARIIKGYKIHRNSLDKSSIMHLLKDINANNYTNFEILNQENQKANNIIFNQIINNQIGNTKLTSAIYFFKSFNISIIYPLNINWIKNLKKHDVKVNILFSKFIYKIYLIISLISALKKFLLILRNVSYTTNRKNYSKSIYFTEFTDIFIYKDKLLFDQNWFTDNLKKEIKIIYHSSKKNINLKSEYFEVRYVKSIYYNLHINDFLKLFIKFFKILIHSLKQFFLNKDDLLLLSKRLENLFFFENNINCSFKNLFYSNSNISNCPNISLNHIQNGVEVFFVPSSSNIVIFKKYLPKNHNTGYFWDLFYFKNVLVLTEKFKICLLTHSRFLSDNNIFVNNYLYNLSFIFPDVKKKKYIYAGIFNTQLFKKYLFLLRGDYHTYYTPKNLYAFYTDLLDFFSKNYANKKIIFFIKKKSDTAKFHSSFEKNIYINLKLKYPHIRIYIIKNINIVKLLKKLDFSISLPNVSASIFAKSLNGNSFYYDPSCSITKEDEIMGSQDIKLITGKYKLHESFREILEK